MILREIQQITELQTSIAQGIEDVDANPEVEELKNLLQTSMLVQQINPGGDGDTIGELGNAKAFTLNSAYS